MVPAAGTAPPGNASGLPSAVTACGQGDTVGGWTDQAASEACHGERVQALATAIADILATPPPPPERATAGGHPNVAIQVVCLSNVLNQNQIQLLSNLVNSNERQDETVNPINDHTNFLVSNLLRGAQLPNNLDVFVVDANSCNVYVLSP